MYQQGCGRLIESVEEHNNQTPSLRAENILWEKTVINEWENVELWYKRHLIKRKDTDWIDISVRLFRYSYKFL